MRTLLVVLILFLAYPCLAACPEDGYPAEPVAPSATLLATADARVMTIVLTLAKPTCVVQLEVMTQGPRVASATLVGSPAIGQAYIRYYSETHATRMVFPVEAVLPQGELRLTLSLEYRAPSQVPRYVELGEDALLWRSNVMEPASRGVIRNGSLGTFARMRARIKQRGTRKARH